MLKKIFIFFGTFFLVQSICYADLSGFASYNTYYQKNTTFLIKKANDYLKLYEKTDDKVLKDKYLKEALRNYYICAKNDFSNIEAHIGLGKVYDEMGVDKYAKMEFNSAYNIDNKNPKLNYRYGDFYYKRRQLSLAQHYFERAYKYGYDKNPDLNLKMSKAYTKLAQQQKAEEHLKIANELNKKEKTKIIVNSAIKQASNVGTIPAVLPQQYVNPVKNDKIPEISTSSVKQGEVVTEKKNKKFKEIPRPVVKNPKFEEAVVKANKIKMIDDVDSLKPMYYLFIK